MAAKDYSGPQTLRSLIRLIVQGLSSKVDRADLATTLDSDDDTTALAASQGKALKEQIDAVSGTVTGEITDKIGQADGIAPLDDSGKIDEKYLPSYVDDVIEGYYDPDSTVTVGEEPGEDTNGAFYSKDKEKTGDPDTPGADDEEEKYDPETEIKPETGKIYVDLNTNYSYRWSGSKFIQITSGVMLEMTEDEVTNLWKTIVKEETKYAVNVVVVASSEEEGDMDGVDASADPALAAEDTTVTITVSNWTSDKECEVKISGEEDPEITVTTGTAATTSDTGSYSFTMPGHAVTVTVSAKEED